MASRSEDRRPEESRGDRALDPALRSRLLQEARTPWRGLRRALWLALAASGAIGLATMALRAFAGGEVVASDLLIQIAALALFGTLLWRDRNPPVDPPRP